MSSLDVFSPATRAWFEQAFEGPTPAQELGWPSIARGGHTLIQAPTGSGKTLAAFLYGIDRLNASAGEGLRLLYVSPLKALNYDIERNLRGPLAGLRSELRVGVRTGDTPQKERAAMVRNPPDILITTPESLFLLLTSQARETLRGIETVIVDEVHAVAGTKRGAHLALSLERLDRLTGKPIQRVGLSATQRPLEEIGRFVSGGREIELVDAGRAKELDLKVVVPLDDMREPEEQQSIWPSIYPEILELVRAHRSTIVFVNNRRLAERLALRLNDLASMDGGTGEAGAASDATSQATSREIARAHHGSLAREQRVEVEELLKKGEIPCLVATSSLELGIDMGAVDLVIQVESPKSVARGLQRVGRAGHELDAVSKGRIFPKYRADLLESAVVVKRMLEGGIEETKIPRNPLDVLAQQIVAICADEEIEVDDLHRLVRGAYPFADLSRVQLENVLDMLDGRYPSDEFAELRARVVWDRTAGVVKGRQGAKRLAVTNAGTIPDRGSSASTWSTAAGGSASSTRRWSTRRGQGRRSCSVPAPGGSRRSPATACSSRRPRESRVQSRSGRARASAARTSSGRRSAPPRASWSRCPTTRRPSGSSREHKLDERAAANLLTFLREQEAATGAVPSDRTIVVERFRDEIGDWRLCILTPFGGRVHAPWALALGARLRESLGLETQAIWSDDGIAIHLPDADAPPPVDEVLLEPEQIEELVTQELGDTALFGARFRENAGRSLLIPRRRPGERTPLWQQRLKAQSLLQVARRYPAFPVVLETYRECLQDVFDLPALKRLLQGLRTRQIDLVDVETASASPYAASLLFDYVANYMYEDDTPAAERRAQALSLDRDLLRELLGQEELRDLIDPGALEEVETRLRGEARTPDELHDLLRRRGDLREGEYPEDLAEPLLAERRAVQVRVAGEQRLIAAEDAGRYRDAVGSMPPGRPAGGLPRGRRRTAPFARASLRALARAVHDRRGEQALRPRRRARAAGARAAATTWSAASCGPGERSASGATRRSCVDSGGRLWPRCGARSSPSSKPPSDASCRAGTASAAGRRCARRSCRCRASRYRSRSGSRTCCLAACPAIGPSSSMRSALRARWSGLARASIASRSTSARTRRPSGRRRRPTVPRRRSTNDSARRSAAVRSSGTTSCSTSGSRPKRRCPRSGISSGPARSRTTPGRRCALLVATRTRSGITSEAETLLAHPRGRGDRHTGPLVVDRDALPRPPRPPRARRAAGRAAGHRHTRRRARRGHPRRLRRGLWRAEGARDARALPARLLRRGSRRRAVRPRRGGRAATRAATEGRGGGRAARARGRRPGAAVWRRAPVAEARRSPGRPRRRRSCRPARRRAGALRRARRSLARAAARARGGLAARRAGALVAHVRAGGAKRLAVERFDSQPVG